MVLILVQTYGRAFLHTARGQCRSSYTVLIGPDATRAGRATVTRAAPAGSARVGLAPAPSRIGASTISTRNTDSTSVIPPRNGHHRPILPAYLHILPSFDVPVL